MFPVRPRPLAVPPAHLLAVLLALALAPAAAAHGGAYVGPSSSASTTIGGGPVAPPVGSGGVVAGSTSGPAAPPTAGSASGVRGASARAASGVPVTAGPAYDGWEHWWESNHDRLLALRQKRWKGVLPPGSPGRLTGRGAGLSALLRRLEPGEVETELVPALLAVSGRNDDRHVLDSTMIALSRSVPATSAAQVGEAAVRLLAHAELSVQGAAALALGILGDLRSSVPLTSLLRDDTAGRGLVGGGPVPQLVRASAAIALGLLGDAASVHALLSALAALPDNERDVKSAIVAALGLVPEDSPAAPVIAGTLTGLLGRGDLDATLLSFVPTTLGKLGERAALPLMVQRLQDDRLAIAVRQSLAIGIGRLATLDDEEAIAVLTRTVRRGSDRQTRHFALVSLARIAADDGDPGRHAEGHAALVSLLLDELAGRGKSSSHRSWAALAAGLYGAAHPGAREALLPVLRRGFDRERDPGFRGAFALGLALLSDHESAPELLEAFQDSRHDDLRGYLGVALGLLQHEPAAADLLALCADKSVAPTFRVKLATALGLMGDRRAVPVLLERLREANNLDDLAGSARALGLVGDATALDPLLDLLADPRAVPATRAFAIVALGLMAERGELPFNAPLREDNNYRAQTPVIAEVLRIL